MFLQVNQRHPHILGTALRKRVQVDITHVLVPDTIVGQLGQSDIPAGDLETHQFPRRGAHHLQQKACARLATKMFAHVADSLISHHRVVNAQYHISLLQSHLGCRHAGIRLIDHDTVQLLVLADKGADAGILASEHHPQVLCLILGIVFCIRVQTPEHSVDARADGLLRVQRVNVKQFQVLIQLVEDVQMLGHLEVMILTLLSLSGERQARQQQHQCDISFHILLFIFHLLPFYL